jgi:membrane protein implicated in regulation of membrane protease activity
MDSLSPLILLAIGLVLMFLEISLYSFFIIWFGVAFVIVAVVEYFYPLSSIWWQLSLIALIALILFALFSRPLKRLVNQNNEVKDDFIKQHGNGVINNQMLNYQGSYFKVVGTNVSQLEGQQVKVIKVEKNNAWIEYE